MLKRMMIAGALSLGVVGFGAGSQAFAGTNVDIGIGLGLGGGGGGRISCGMGARVVRSAGFRGVRPIDCSGSEYAYRGFRHDRMFKIVVKSRNGRISDVYRLRGGYGGYDDGYGDGYDGGYDGGYDDEY